MSLATSLHRIREAIRDAIRELEDDPRRARPALAKAERLCTEHLDELTPVRPPSRTDMRAARETAERFSADAVLDILKEGRGE